MSITAYDGQIIVDFEANSLHGAPGLGTYLLRFSIRYLTPGTEDGELYFRASGAKVYAGKQELFLGTAQPELPMMFRSSRSSDKGYFLYELQLSAESVEQIEKLRAGKDIEFRLDITGEYHDRYNDGSTRESVRYRAHQNEWISTLKSMGHKGSVLFDFTAEADPENEENTSLHAIQIAKEHFFQGNYDDAVAKCRIALESVIKKWGGIDSVRASVRNKNKKGMSKEMRFFHVLDQMVHFTHLAHHPDETDNYISYTRSEAVFVLGSTMAAVSSYLERQPPSEY